jgi:hypothetical protein
MSRANAPTIDARSRTAAKPNVDQQIVKRALGSVICGKKPKIETSNAIVNNTRKPVNNQKGSFANVDRRFLGRLFLHQYSGLSIRVLTAIVNNMKGTCATPPPTRNRQMPIKRKIRLPFFVLM